MQPDATQLLEIAGIQFPLIGFYDAPDTTEFEPLVVPPAGSPVCVFAYFRKWLKGVTVHLTREHFGCGGAGHTLCGVEARTREELISFLVDQEGLKPSHALMEEWLEKNPPYRQEHENILIGPLHESQYEFLKTITFPVNPDQLGLLMLGAQYHSRASDPPAMLAPFGSGCMQLVGLFEDLTSPQAVLGATDIAMRRYLPPEILAFTVTKPMFEQLCALDEKSFLHKPFWQGLKKARSDARDRKLQADIPTPPPGGA